MLYCACMATLWANYSGNNLGRWHDQAYSSGWSHTINFSSLLNLTDQMAQRNLHGNVTRLGMVAHGDSPGQVVLDRNLVRGTIHTFSREFTTMRSFLTRNSKLIFFSCIAGMGRDGDDFLCAVSRLLPGVTVIGFVVYGITSANRNLAALSPMTPGSMRPANRLGMVYEGHGLLQPWSIFSKWARNGRIVRNSPLERDDDGHCANPNCRGHSDRRHVCPGWG